MPFWDTPAHHPISTVFTMKYSKYSKYSHGNGTRAKMVWARWRAFNSFAFNKYHTYSIDGSPDRGCLHLRYVVIPHAECSGSASYFSSLLFFQFCCSCLCVVWLGGPARLHNFACENYKLIICSVCLCGGWECWAVHI